MHAEQGSSKACIVLAARIVQLKTLAGDLIFARSGHQPQPLLAMDALAIFGLCGA